MVEINAEYIPARDLKRTEREMPKVSMGIQLKSGKVLEDITPYKIVEQPESRKSSQQKELFLLYLDSSGKHKKIKINELRGIDVVEGTDDYSGKLLVQFTYYKPSVETGGADQIEQDPRKVLVTGIAYGVHETHKKHGERNDFYLVGVDVNKITEVDDGKRVFPFWRILEMYGIPSEIAGKFKTQAEN